jgi:hypothetical protein
MPLARGLVAQFDSDDLSEPLPVVAPGAPVESQTITELLATIARLTARVVELELPPERRLPLKVATYDSKCEYETLRVWCIDGLVAARREGACEVR